MTIILGRLRLIWEGEKISKEQFFYDRNNLYLKR
jgi:hypothetical protein